MKYLIVGLGNIGAEYENTRHNVGFTVVEGLADELGASWKQVTLGSLAEAKHKGRTLLLLKPNTYMNLSGKAVKYWMDKEKIPLENILVILDELQLDLGTVRLRGQGSDGGHNGLKDIQAQLNTTNYPRLRVGIGKDFPIGGQVRYVLGAWNSDETTLLKDVIKASANAVKQFVSIGLKRAMDSVNAVATQPKENKKKN